MEGDRILREQGSIHQVQSRKQMSPSLPPCHPWDGHYQPLEIRHGCDIDPRELRVGIMLGSDHRDFPDADCHGVSQEEKAFPTQQWLRKYGRSQRSHEVQPKSSNVGLCCCPCLDWSNSNSTRAKAQSSRLCTLETPAVRQRRADPVPQLTPRYLHSPGLLLTASGLPLESNHLLLRSFIPGCPTRSTLV